MIGISYFKSDVIVVPHIGVEYAETWYRYEDRLYSIGSDDYGDSLGSEVRVILFRCEVIKHTTCGAWVNGPNGKRFVNVNHTKSFACPTIEQAKISFIARKRRQASIYRNRVKNAERAIEIISETDRNDK